MIPVPSLKNATRTKRKERVLHSTKGVPHHTALLFLTKKWDFCLFVHLFLLVCLFLCLFVLELTL